jgi:murein DD-endopeptidase MepM/ murein hydrolase activator NlpD
MRFSNRIAPVRRAPRSVHWRWWRPAFALAAAVLGAFILTETSDSDARINEGATSLPTHVSVQRFSAGAAGALDYPFEPLIERPAIGPLALIASVNLERAGWTVITVESGDNLSRIFSRLGLSGTDLHQVLELGAATTGLKDLRPGQRVLLRREGARVIELVHEEDLLRSVHVRRNNGGFVAELKVVEPDRMLTTATGVIDSSLFVAGQNAGLSDAMVMQLADIFGWDIDFVLDIRNGDRFSVIFEEYFREGHKVRDGVILAAEFTNQGETYRAVRYTGADGHSDYYSQQGNAMRKAFLRTPVNFSRISSHFNLARRHPILNRIRAHRGVDYAAPHGTPVKATGNARVVAVERSAGYGNVVTLQHSGSYNTVYAHLSRFARGLRKGQPVRQGQTIGYVGSTGLATGPHLHYEFRVNGAHQNPLTVKLPKSLPLPREHLADFRAKAAPLLAELDRLAAAPAFAHTTSRSLAANDSGAAGSLE